MSSVDVRQLLDVRVRRPERIAALAATRSQPNGLVGSSGRLMLVAADHPARGALRVGSDALAMADRVAVMQQGRLLQVDTPQQVYRKPVSPYVAQFFGTANVIPAAWLDRHLGVYTALSAETEVCLRAEHLSLSSPGQQHFEGRVVQVHYLGAYYEVGVEVGGEAHLVLNITHRVEIGECLPLKIEIEKLHFFK